MKKISFSLQIFTLLIILGVAFFFMRQSSLGESAIMDELAHIPAGYSYVKYQDFRLNPEHPPLLKALSALPLLFQNLNFPTAHKSWSEDINGQWEAGSEFLYHSGNNADQIIQTARIFPIILTLITILLIYLWSRELLGNWWSLLPPFLFGLSPTVLAHGHYVTTDLSAAFGFVLGIYLFTKFLLKPSRWNLIWAGVGFGIAELTKFSLVLLIPSFFLMIFIFAWAESNRLTLNSAAGRLRSFLKSFWYYLKPLLLIFIIGYVLVYLVYFILTLNYPPEKQVADTKFILSSFSPRFLPEINIALAENKISRPIAEYLLGVLMVLQRSAGGNTGYFLGEVSAAGSHYYFPTVFALKEAIPSLILILTALIISLINVVKKIKWPLAATKNNFLNYLGTHFPEFSMLLFVVIYWAYSIRSPLNIGVRHLLPTLPFIYILTAAGLKAWFQKKVEYSPISLSKIITSLKQIIRKSLKIGFVTILLLWYLGETVATSPYFLSYFNQFGGGIDQGYRYVTDSNYDWGQDLKRLKDWTDKNLPAGRQVAVDYFGGGNPKYYLGETEENWWSSRGNPKNIGIEWLAVSVNTLESAMGRLVPGQSRNSDDEYSWLKIFRPAEKDMGQVPKPDFRAGTSIFIYHL